MVDQLGQRRNWTYTTFKKVHYPIEVSRDIYVQHIPPKNDERLMFSNLDLLEMLQFGRFTDKFGSYKMRNTVELAMNKWWKYDVLTGGMRWTAANPHPDMGMSQKD